MSVFSLAVTPPCTLANLRSIPSSELVARVAERDREAFSELYDRTSSLVYGLALRTTRSRSLAEEVTQDVYVQVWRQAEGFDAARGSVRTWVAMIAHRRAVDAVRRAEAAGTRERSMPGDAPDRDVAETVVEWEERERVRAALQGLTDLQREVIELAYFGGLTYRQVAERLNTPLGTVKTRMRDGLARIRASLELTDD